MNRAILLSALLALALLPAAPAAPVPGDCRDACAIDSHAFGYLPPVAVVTSGAPVTWRSLDMVHVTAEGAGFGGDIGCFNVHHTPGADAQPVRFVATHVGLQAYVGDDDATPENCATAIDLQDGRYALPYYCLLHTPMRGVLLVAPAA